MSNFIHRSLPLFALAALLAACGGSGTSSTDDAAAPPSDAPLDATLDAPPPLDTSSLDTSALDALTDASSLDVPTLDALADAGRGGCRDNTDCSANEFGLRVCDLATATCVQCTSGSAAACGTGQYCTAANRCESGCAADSQCASMRCDTMRHVCLGCMAEDQCPPGQICTTTGLCIPGCTPTHACPTGDTCCSGVCQHTQTDPSNCGACNTACTGTTPACQTGACRPGPCNPGLADCDMDPMNGCETELATSPTHCGTCGTACSVPNTTTACMAGRCQAGGCAMGFGDCDMNPMNGCETPLNTLANCGGCGTACAPARATGNCDTGVCRVATCTTGFGNCDNNPANGCEANLASDVSHCGACGTVCPSPPRAIAGCGAGTCQYTCAANAGDCDGDATNGCETDLTTAMAHCGACGRACSLPNATSRCGGSSCALTACSAGFGDCDTNASNGCETPLNSPTHCGMCGRACPTGQVCSNGACMVVCPVGQTLCAGACTSTMTDPSHCGACARPCSLANATPLCSAGVCAVASCANGFGNCDGNPANGCETPTASVTHCGACARACTTANGTPVCRAGTCDVGMCNAGFGDCDGSPGNGCEATLTTDARNCGGCGRACTGGATCVAGACVAPRSCSAIRAASPAIASGVYTIDPDGSAATVAPFQVYCDMTRNGGGWILMGKIGATLNHGQISPFTADLNANALLDGNLPGANDNAHWNLARFDAYGSVYTVRTDTDSFNDGARFQFTYFRPRTGAICPPSQIGRNWVGTNTPTLLQYLNNTSTSGMANTTWINLGRYDPPGGSTIWMFSYRNGSSGSNCLSGAGQTVECHAPAGTIANEPGLAGTMTAAFGVGDGVPHSWSRRATYWIRDTVVAGTP